MSLLFMALDGALESHQEIIGTIRDLVMHEEIMVMDKGP
jgi:hypothetical protein